MPATEVVGYRRNNHTTDAYLDKGDVVDPSRMATFNSSEETALARKSPADAVQLETALHRQSSEETYDSNDLPLNGIFVTNEIKMTTEERTRRAPRTPTRERSRSKAVPRTKVQFSYQA